MAVGKVSIRYGSEPEVAAGEVVSGNFFSGLGVQMARGRGFTLEDETSHAQVAVLSYDFWTRRFSREPGMLGQTMYVKGVPITIIGVSAAASPDWNGAGATPTSGFPCKIGWTLTRGVTRGTNGKTFYGVPDWWCLLLTARLAPGVTPQQAVSRVQPQFQNAAYVGVDNPKAGEQKPLLSLAPGQGAGCSMPTTINGRSTC